MLQAAAQLLALVLAFEHPADAVVARYLREHHEFGPRERAVLSETVYAVLRKKLLLEHLAQSGHGAHARRLALLGFAAPRDFLQPALNDQEKQWLTACDALPAAALPESCLHNLPGWLADALRQQLGDEFEALAASLLQPAPLDLRVNILKQKRPQTQAALWQHAIESKATPYSPWGLRVTGKPALTRLAAYADGAFEIQDEGSQLLALLLQARRGELVVDFCAGAGGKTLALGAAMRGQGRLYAFDTSAHRLQALAPRLARAGLHNVHTAAIAHEWDARVRALAGKADRVLVDAPCSGLGTLRRAPDLKWRTTPAQIAAYAQRQAAILQAAATLVKPGGRLLYATCSLLAEENEAVAAAFSAQTHDFTPLNAAQCLTALKVPAAPTLTTTASHLRLWPHRHGTDGFFAALWQREGR
jgi:16S rRNA (cytosine967-C5)-methyltransferase